ncbi:uncharacterized protein B0H18DRAFT_888278, partial [Fomitopsis serialis]|uniref:uncharacterized protein n=1 Tax=Fomitopsis serialis TaxID=139415 RepID=UPI002007FD24
RFARLALPNGQVARSAWKECERAVEDVRRSRNVKLNINGEMVIAEVEYYFLAHIEADRPQQALALIRPYSRPNTTLLARSSQSLWASQRGSDDELTLVNVKDIQAVVAMCPLPQCALDKAGMQSGMFLIEKLGLDILYMAGAREDIDDEDDVP